MKQTRLETIRNMSDSEFAQFLCEFVSRYKGDCEFCEASKYCYNGHNGMLEYLKEEIEEDEEVF